MPPPVIVHPVWVQSYEPSVLLRPLLSDGHIQTIKWFLTLAMALSLVCITLVMRHLIAHNASPDDELDGLICSACYTLAIYLLQIVCTWVQCDVFEASNPGVEEALLPRSRFRAVTAALFAVWCVASTPVAPSSPTERADAAHAICCVRRMTITNMVFAFAQLCIVMHQATYWRGSPVLFIPEVPLASTPFAPAPLSPSPPHMPTCRHAKCHTAHAR